jgi:hypothetical protein
MGVAVIILTNPILLPVMISYGIGKKTSRSSREDAVKEASVLALYFQLRIHGCSDFRGGGCHCSLSGGVWYGQNLKIGDLDQGAPELHPFALQPGQ